MKILVITNLFPNRQQLQRGVFNKIQFGRLAQLTEMQIVSPLPWVPPFIREKQKWLLRAVPIRDRVFEMDVCYPRYFVVPKIGRLLSGSALEWALRKHFVKYPLPWQPDAVFAAWAYPDAWAAARLAKNWRCPFFVKTHGSDINILAASGLRRQMIAKALQQANGLVVNTQDLKSKVMDLGVDESRVHLIYNGIDHQRFYRRDQYECQSRLQLDKACQHIVFIGNLVPVKDVNSLIMAMPHLPDKVRLSIVGSGPLREVLKKTANEFGVSERVDFKGQQPHDEIADWMNAADVLCLPSLNEGCPNVILEAMACGTPVVASAVGGCTELIHPLKNGLLVPAQQPNQLAEALNIALNHNWDFAKIAAMMGKFDWDQGVEKIYQILKTGIEKGQIS